MDNLPFKRSSFNHKSILPPQTTDFYLRLLLLLHNMSYSQTLMQRCLMRTKAGKFPNFTSTAGSPFFFRLPVPANPGDLQHYQLSLSDGDTLPRWMMFRQQTAILAGLALSEDCGTYHLQLSFTEENCAAHFHLHILNRTEKKNPLRDKLSCSEGEMILWASLLLQLNPLSLDGSQHIHLVNSMTNHLHILVSRFSLFSERSSVQKQEKLRICRQGGMLQDVTVDVAELLWSIGCHKEEQQTDLAKVLKHSVKTGHLGSSLGAPVLGWRVLCAASEGKHRAKRDLLVQKVTPAPEMAFLHPTRVLQNLKLSQIHALNTLNLKPSLSTTLFDFVETKLVQAHTRDSKTVISDSFGRQTDSLSHQSDINNEIHFTTQIEKIQKPFTYPFSVEQTKIYPYNTAVNSLLEQKAALYLPKHASTIKHIVTMLDLESFHNSALLKSCRPHSSDPSLAPHSVTSILTHEAVDRELLPTSLTLRPHQETPICAESNKAIRNDSDSHATVSAWGHTVYTQSENHDSVTVKSALINPPSVSHQLSKENYTDVLPLSLTSKTLQSLQSSNKTPSTHLFSHVSPYLVSELLKVTQCFDMILNLPLAPSGMNQDANIQPTAQPVSSTALTGPLTFPGQSEMEPSLSTSFLEPSAKTFTPALPSEQVVFTQQHKTPEKTNPASAEEFLKVSSLTSLLKTFSTFSPPGVAASLPNGQTQPSSLLLPTSVSLPVGFPSSAPPEILPSLLRDASFTEKPSVSSLQNMQSEKHFPDISIIPGNTTFLTLNPPTHPVSGFLPTRPVSEGHSDPTAPSTAQESYTISSSHQPLSLEPSFPLCGKSMAQDMSCYSPIESISYESRATHAEEFLTSLSPDKGYLGSQTSLVEYLSLHAISLPSGDLLEGQMKSNVSAFLLGVSTMDLSVFFKTESVTFNLPLSLSESPLQGVILPTTTQNADDLNANCVSLVNSLFICQTSAANSPVTEELPLILTSLQTARPPSSTRGQSSVQSTSSSASISTSINLPPGVLQSIPPLTATVGLPFHYTIPPKTFVDPEEGNSDALSVELQLIDRPPISVGTWLTLEGLELHGVPLEVDLQFAPQDLLLIASDRQGLRTQLSLTLDLRRRSVKPCHIFTLTVQRSLHSMLRHRHRVELLLRKLSRFFNSSSSHHLSIVSMTSGSTVVSWYNYSLCETGQIRVMRCHIDQVEKMWLEMGGADGSVHPAFRNAMLPEFPITKVGPVSLSPECFSFTPTPAVSSSTPAVHRTLTPHLDTNTSTSCISASPTPLPTSQEEDTQHWIAGVLTALLIVCLLILIVLIVAAVLYFCRDHRWSRTDAIWPAGQLLALQRRDWTATRPRRPPIFQPELPPPPLRLWIGLSNDDEWRLSSDYEWDTKTL